MRISELLSSPFNISKRLFERFLIMLVFLINVRSYHARRSNTNFKNLLEAKYHMNTEFGFWNPRYHTYVYA